MTEFLDVVGKVLVILAGSGIGLKLVIDFKSSKKEESKGDNEPLTHKDLLGHSNACAGKIHIKIDDYNRDVHCKIDQYHNEVMKAVSNHGERIIVLETLQGVNRR
jgi:hypothetical protein